MSDRHFWLSEAQVVRLQPLLSNKPRDVPRVDDRRVISGIVHVLRTRCRWRDAPPAYGPHRTLDRLEDWRRIATRYDNPKPTYSAAVHLAASVMSSS